MSLYSASERQGIYAEFHVCVLYPQQRARVFLYGCVDFAPDAPRQLDRMRALIEDLQNPEEHVFGLHALTTSDLPPVPLRPRQKQRQRKEFHVNGDEYWVSTHEAHYVLAGL